MKSKLLLLLLLLPTLCCRGQYTWNALPTAPQSWRCDDFYFVNPNLGWVINPNYDNVTPFQFGRIFKTTDGGNTWQLLIDSSNTFYRCVGFADSLTGWVGNIADTAYYASFHGTLTNDTVPLYQTIDGGVTWTPANLPQPHPAGICGISVINDSVVYAYGRWFSPAGYVKTTNKGVSWAFTDLDSLAFGLIDGRFFGQDTGFITGMGTDHKAIILYTVNGGASWSTVYHSTRSDSDRVWKIFFPSRDTGYASIEYGGSDLSHSAWMLTTTNGGLSWAELPFVANYDEEGIGFINNTVGWLGGDYAQPNYITRDGGNTWSIDSSFGVSTPPYVIGTGFVVNRFRSFGDTLIYASGNTVYKLYAPSLGIKGVQTEDATFTNYPNPFENKTTIAYTLIDATGDIVLKIYDVLGRQLFFRDLGAQTAGKHDLIFDENLPDGVYYYTLSNDAMKLAGKMQVVR